MAPKSPKRFSSKSRSLTRSSLGKPLDSNENTLASGGPTTSKLGMARLSSHQPSFRPSTVQALQLVTSATKASRSKSKNEITATLKPSKAKIPSRPSSAGSSRQFSLSKVNTFEAVPTERSRMLKLRLQKAVKDRKIFTIAGNFPAVRKALVRRGWMEKSFSMSTFQSLSLDPTSKSDDLAWVARVLREYPPDFIWTFRRENINWATLLPTQIINRFSRASFTSKVGITGCMQNHHWYADGNTAVTHFPRCYRLSISEEKLAFINDFKITACLSLLTWLVAGYESEGAPGVIDSDSPVTTAVVHFAISNLKAYVKVRNHSDLDSAGVSGSTSLTQSWDTFLRRCHSVVTENYKLALAESKDSAEIHYNAAKKTLKTVANFWPQLSIDGVYNIWICKPGARARGNGIVVKNQLTNILGLLDKSNHQEASWVVQKYIERPMLIYNTKFDIRQWFLVTDWNPLTVWFYKDSYIRFCSTPFNILNFHESVHLCNNAVQVRYQNAGTRDRQLPKDNMWDHFTLHEHFCQMGKPEAWDTIVYPGMVQGVLGVLLASQETCELRKNSFELYGADFMLTEDFKPWMIEINSSPCMASTTSVTAKMCPKCLEDCMKVIIDRRQNPQAKTGRFELVYKQEQAFMPMGSFNYRTASVGSMVVNGQKFNFKTDSKVQSQIELSQSVTGSASVGKLKSLMKRFKKKNTDEDEEVPETSKKTILLSQLLTTSGSASTSMFDTTKTEQVNEDKEEQ